MPHGYLSNWEIWSLTPRADKGWMHFIAKEVLIGMWLFLKEVGFAGHIVLGVFKGTGFAGWERGTSKEIGWSVLTDRKHKGYYKGKLAIFKENTGMWHILFLN